MDRIFLVISLYFEFGNMNQNECFVDIASRLLFFNWWRDVRSGVFAVNFEHISHFCSVSIVDLEEVNVC